MIKRNGYLGRLGASTDTDKRGTLRRLQAHTVGEYIYRTKEAAVIGSADIHEQVIQRNNNTHCTAAMESLIQWKITISR